MTERIWNNFKVRLGQFIHSKVAEPDDAEDILQEVFIKIHLHKDQLLNKSSLESWIFRITRNTITDYYRKKKAANYDQAETIFPVEETKVHLLESCVMPFIEMLAPEDQDILLKVEIQQWSQKDYARAADLSYTAAKSRIQRARKKLKNAFMQCCNIVSDSYGNILEVKSTSCSCPIAASF